MKRDNRYRLWTGVAFIPAIVFVGGAAFGQSVDRDTDATGLDEIIVRATRMERPANKIAAAISVIGN